MPIFQQESSICIISRQILSISAGRHLIDDYVPCMRGVKIFIYDNVQIKVITIYSGAVWLKQLLLYFILYMPPILDFGVTTQYTM